jgi:putative transposase
MRWLKRSNGLYKTDVMHRLGPWRNLQAVEMAKLDGVDRFYHRRLPDPIGNVLPAEAESRLFFQTRWACRRGMTHAN